MRALEAWLAASTCDYGPVFRKVDRWGNIEHARLSGEAVRVILAGRAKAAGITVHDTERLSPHGLRAGFVTDAYMAGTRDEQVMDHTWTCPTSWCGSLRMSWCQARLAAGASASRWASPAR
ncbi:hypothetical protein JYK14_10325 [Siccirubricoccus sp. KC 17139]|uniref:Tyr recombinase domain-containing protein n=1 Tax=Siccirubricoccus soli TaxID=2899147 RepID=A0ABT1D3Q5_9PROT|nr:hypothetical protein [Siccirubricoccus soli]MCO6416555.1 hypothetical protein [Siccirubricoccus soli]MCP2682690.1 hypothetical protein [Siccirubricoccus soli]